MAEGDHQNLKNLHRWSYCEAKFENHCSRQFVWNQESILSRCFPMPAFPMCVLDSLGFKVDPRNLFLLKCTDHFSKSNVIVHVVEKNKIGFQCTCSINPSGFTYNIYKYRYQKNLKMFVGKEQHISYVLPTLWSTQLTCVHKHTSRHLWWTE